jgi:hypothetical protein
VLGKLVRCPEHAVLAVQFVAVEAEAEAEAEAGRGVAWPTMSCTARNRSYAPPASPPSSGQLLPPVRINERGVLAIGLLVQLAIGREDERCNGGTRGEEARCDLPRGSRVNDTLRVS